MYYEKIKRLDIEDIDNMTVSELQDVLRSGKQTLQKRKEQFDRTGQYSPAFDKFNPDDIKTRGRKNVLKNQAKEVVEKLNEQTTTRAGAREWKRNVKAAMGKEGKRISESQMRDLWRAFDKFREDHKNLDHELGSPKAVRLMQNVKIGSEADMISQLNDFAKEAMENARGTELTDREYNMLSGNRRVKNPSDIWSDKSD